jgi:hypothetical protein
LAYGSKVNRSQLVSQGQLSLAQSHYVAGRADVGVFAVVSREMVAGGICSGGRTRLEALCLWRAAGLPWSGRVRRQAPERRGADRLGGASGACVFVSVFVRVSPLTPGGPALSHSTVPLPTHGWSALSVQRLYHTPGLVTDRGRALGVERARTALGVPEDVGQDVVEIDL